MTIRQLLNHVSEAIRSCKSNPIWCGVSTCYAIASSSFMLLLFLKDCSTRMLASDHSTLHTAGFQAILLTLGLIIATPCHLYDMLTGILSRIGMLVGMIATRRKTTNANRSD